LNHDHKPLNNTDRIVIRNNIQLRGGINRLFRKNSNLNSTSIHVDGAQVTGIWTELTSDTDQGITESDGTLTLRSDSEKNLASGTFIFNVTGVYLVDWTYNTTANAEYYDSIKVPNWENFSKPHCQI